jgi:hypothetical protein
MGLGRVLVEGKMGLRAEVVGEVRRENQTKMALAKGDVVVKAIASHRADKTFDKRVLPQRAGCRQHLLDAEAGDPMAELGAVDSVAIAQQIYRDGIAGERLDDLLCGPGSGGMFGDVEVEHAAAAMSKDHEDEKDAEGGGRAGEEVHRHEGAEVIVQEGAVGLGWGFARPFRHQGGDGALADFDAELEQLAMDARAPHVGLASAMRRTRARTRLSVGGLRIPAIVITQIGPSSSPRSAP